MGTALIGCSTSSPLPSATHVSTTTLASTTSSRSVTASFTTTSLHFSELTTTLATHASTTTRASAASSRSVAASFTTTSLHVSEPITTLATYDCLETTTDYHWSEGKMKYCCATHAICIKELHQKSQSTSAAAKSPAPGPTVAEHARTQSEARTEGAATFDCTAWEKGYAGGKGAWSLEQKRWCCEEQSVCLTTSSQPYDCQAGYNNWRAGWSEAKQEWCCINEARGCT